MIIGIGFAQADAINKVAGENPDLYFAIVDSVVDQPKFVQSIVFKEAKKYALFIEFIVFYFFAFCLSQKQERFILPGIPFIRFLEQ